jgi:predicted permease
VSRLLDDFRFAARTLRRNLGFTVAAVVALALGIGSCAAIFSVVNEVLLEPLPYPEPDRLVQLITVSQIGNQSAVSIPKYVIWRDHTSVFESIAAYDIGALSVNLSQGDFAEALTAARVSADYFTLFGAHAKIGRTFSADEDRYGGPRVAVISDSLWRGRFRGDPRLVGSIISIEQQPCKVIGVLAPGFGGSSFNGNRTTDVWLPLQADPSSADHVSRVRVTARLKPGIKLSDAQNDVGATMGPFLKKYRPQSASEAPLLFLEGFTAIPLRDAVVGDVRPALYLLTGAVGFVLLISCANVASLLLARASRRRARSPFEPLWARNGARSFGGCWPRVSSFRCQAAAWVSRWDISECAPCWSLVRAIFPESAQTGRQSPLTGASFSSPCRSL